jgi:hypothetical protein
MSEASRALAVVARSLGDPDIRPRLTKNKNAISKVVATLGAPSFRSPEPAPARSSGSRCPRTPPFSPARTSRTRRCSSQPQGHDETVARGPWERSAQLVGVASYGSWWGAYGSSPECLVCRGGQRRRWASERCSRRWRGWGGQCPSRETDRHYRTTEGRLCGRCLRSATINRASSTASSRSSRWAFARTLQRRLGFDAGPAQDGCPRHAT